MRDVAVIGLGYVGLPLVREAARSGLTGYGLDVSIHVVDALSGGKSHVDDLSNADITCILDSGFEFTTDMAALRLADTVVICVPTPLGSDGGPDLSAVLAATTAISAALSPGMLVVLESTTWPGTTQEVVLPILEKSGLRGGVDFNLAFSPERIDPGNSSFSLRNTPKVVGGLTPECGDRAEMFYSRIVDEVVRARGLREAEMSKLLENTYRQVNIALVNEMSKFSHELGIDIWDVIRCAETKPYGFQAFRPGPGVGGHCIPIDPSYLSHRVQAELGYPFRFVELAQEVNRSMPHYVVTRAQQILNDLARAVRGAKILILGVTYKPGIADQRESPAKPLGSALKALGADLEFYDHFVSSWELETGTLDRVPDLWAAVADADLVLHLQQHDDYSSDQLASYEVPVLDTRGVLEGPMVQLL